MTAVAALPVMSIPGIATAIPKTADDAAGMDSIFDDLLAALAPIASDQPSGQAIAAAQATPPPPALASDTPIPQAMFPDAASLEAALGDAMSVTPLLPDAPAADPPEPNTALPNPIIGDTAVLPPPQNGNTASVQPRTGRSEKPAANAPANDDTPDDSLVAALTMMMVPQLPPAGDVPAAPVNPPAEDVPIANVAATGASNPLPGMETNAVPQPVPDAAAASPPVDATAQPAKGETAATPAQAAVPFVLSQAASAAAPAPLKGAPSSAPPEKPTAPSAVDLGKTETIARVPKATISAAVAQANNPAPTLPSGGSSAKADRTPSNSHVSNETASRPDVAAMAVPQLDNLATSLASNGFGSTTATSHTPIELSGITAANAMWAGAPQSGDTPIRLVLSAPGFVPDTASMDALALRIAAKSADGESQFSIRLDPPSLGRIEIHLNMDSQGNAQAQLSADRPQTLDALQRDSGALERALKDAGLDLPGGLSFSLKGDGKSAAWRDSQNSGRGRALQIDAVDGANSIAASLGLTSTGQAWGAASTRLDIRV